MVTRLRGLQSSTVPDPTKKSASYVPAQPGLLFSLRSTTEGRGVFPGRSILANPVARRYVNPRTQGFVPPVPIIPLPRITIDAGVTDFGNAENVVFTFSGVPPASTFEAVVANGSNLADIKVVSIYSVYDVSGPSPDLMGGVTISITPTWTGSTFTSDLNAPTLTNASGGFPTPDAVITFSGVPIVSDIAIIVDGAAPA